jgi:hypothetical protein
MKKPSGARARGLGARTATSPEPRPTPDARRDRTTTINASPPAPPKTPRAAPRPPRPTKRTPNPARTAIAAHRPQHGPRRTAARTAEDGERQTQERTGVRDENTHDVLEEAETFRRMGARAPDRKGSRRRYGIRSETLRSATGGADVHFRLRSVETKVQGETIDFHAKRRINTQNNLASQSENKRTRPS